MDRRNPHGANNAHNKSHDIRCIPSLMMILLLRLQSSLDVATDPWGIKVERVEIKDVKLPHQLQRAMAAEAEASREARAKVSASHTRIRLFSMVVGEKPCGR